jgi:outer membrane protein OmpA-like peptidoglycan-associated protein
MLDDVELEKVQSIEAEEEHAVSQHSVPALEGDFLQRLDRRAIQITLHGILTGPDVRPNLEKLREKFRTAAPVSFVSDITTATKVDKVLIEELGVRELAGKPERFEYAFAIREFIPPPAPRTVPPPPIPPQPQPEIATLIVEVIVEGEPDFDFSKVTVTADGTQDDGASLSRTLTNRTENVWTEDDMPPGQYTVSAVVTDPEEMSGSESARVRAGETTQVKITLRRGTGIAKAFIIHFRFDSAFVEPCMVESLARVFKYAQDNPNEKVIVVGHTDLVGSGEYNQSLSERRARSVFAFLTFGTSDALRVSAINDLNNLRKQATGALPSINDTWKTREYQYILQTLQFYSGNIDEIHGPQTDRAVREFQQTNGLPVTGVVDEATWPKLVEAYLGAGALALPESRFLPNANAQQGCDAGILKWLGCGEQDPVKNTEDAWRPNRRTEILFVRADALPCDVPPPVTLNLPPPPAGAQPNQWCLGPGDPANRCCFLTRKKEQPNKFLVKPAEPEKITLSGTVTFDDGTRVANEKYFLIAPDGEFLHTDADGKADLGERPQGPQRGRPIPNRTDDQGNFSYPNQTPVGVYIMEFPELKGPPAESEQIVARALDDPPQAAIGNVICMRINGQGAPPSSA